MKRIAVDSKTAKRTRKPAPCKHYEVCPVAAFIDSDGENSKAYLLQVCDSCGENFLLLGQYPLTIC